MSSMEPVLTNALNPTSSRRLQSRIAVSSAPDWLRKATLPGLAMPAAKVAFRPLIGFITPRQFGPMMRIFPRRAFSRTCRSSSTPGGPSSLKPAEMMIAPRTPASTHSAMMPGTVGAGVTTTARSTFSGTSFIDLYALMPRTLGRFGLTGKTVPPKGLETRFHSSVRPTLFGVSVAPMTATLRGEKMTSSGWRSWRRTSWAVSVVGAAGFMRPNGMAATASRQHRLRRLLRRRLRLSRRRPHQQHRRHRNHHGAHEQRPRADRLRLARLLEDLRRAALLHLVADVRELRDVVDRVHDHRREDR